MSESYFSAEEIKQLKSRAQAMSRRADKIDAEIARLQTERERLGDALSAVRVLADLSADASPRTPSGGSATGGSDPELADLGSGAAGDDAVAQRQHFVPSGSDTTFPAEIKKIVDRRRGPLSNDDVRQELRDGPLAERLRQSDKGFYHGISRLAERGEIVKQDGWLFSLEGHESYVSDVKQGIRPSVPPRASRNRGSPLSDEILRFVETNPQGVPQSQIIAHLRTIDSTRESASGNAGGVYNAVKRLNDQSKIRRVGNLVYPIADGDKAVHENGAEETSSTPEASGANGALTPFAPLNSYPAQ